MEKSFYITLEKQDSGPLDRKARKIPISADSIWISVSENDRLQRAEGWQTRKLSLSAFTQQMLTHAEVHDKKAAKAFLPGAIQGDRRKKAAVCELSAVVLDLDKGETFERIRETLQSKNYYAIVYSTHSHMTSETPIKLDDYRSFSGTFDVSVEGARQFLLDKRHYRKTFVDEIEIVAPATATANGPVCIVRHAPLPKYRIVLPLKSPLRRIEFMKVGGDEAQFDAIWKARYAAVANSLGVQWDVSCSDVARAFFYPSCRPGAERFSEVLPGDLLDLNDFAIEQPVSKSTHSLNTPRRDLNFTHQGVNLRAWIGQYDSTFRIETALRQRAPSHIFRSPRAGESGVHIICPFEDEHSETGGNGTFVINAGENGQRSFGIHCSHDHCLTDRGNGTAVDRLVFVQKMLETAWITTDDLLSPDLGGGPISARVFHEMRRDRSFSDDLWVVDREGAGMDVGIFHANAGVKTGQFDFTRLNTLCGTQIGSDITAAQMAEFISSGRVTVSNLMECCARAKNLEAEPYMTALADLARKKTTGELSARDIDDSLAEIQKKFNAKRRAVEEDFKRAKSLVSAKSFAGSLGLLSPAEAALINPHRDYVRDFAKINTGGKGMMMNLRQPDLSKALMGRDDFEFLYRKDWIQIGKDIIYPARCFLAKPPKNAQEYLGGLVFKPSGTVAADEYNLFRGMLVEPDASGSCSLLHELICEVWAQNDASVAEWVLEWLMHIIACPGERVDTCIAVRGEPGDGKSIVFAKLLSSILGDMVLRVANHKMILGDFNEALVGKLAIVLEEAAFAGDKNAFDKMKELITGDKVLINPKFKAPITVDNYARLVVISNHDHFLHIKPGDRRYTVLETSSAWRGTDKFEHLLDQWNNKGGAERFVYEALNHSFRRIGGSEQLLINTNVKTDAAVRQMALSRSALEKCIVDLLVRGDFRTLKGDEVPVGGEASFGFDRWRDDIPLKMQSQRLEQYVRLWLRDFDPSATRHDCALHTIIKTLHHYVGATGESRPKAPSDADGRRAQLPTMRQLPPRRDALNHARKAGLITEEEYSVALQTKDTLPPVAPAPLLHEEPFGRLQTSVANNNPLPFRFRAAGTE